MKRKLAAAQERGDAKKHIKKRARLALMAASTAIGLTMATTAPAAAATHDVSATLNCAGALFQSGNFRAHTAGSGASLQLTANAHWASVWTLRTGLRNTSGTQVTATLEQAPTNRSKHSYKTSSGSTSIPNTSLAMNARVGKTETTSGCVALWPPTFSGILTL
ncbi:hypothetical protein [Microbacterium album]|nr:hypothetical protein [Microbacterium album]